MQYRPRRRVTSFDVTLDTDRGRRRADIVDVTERGARIRLEVGNLDEGSDVALAIRGLDRKARVVWCKEGEAGLAFAQALSLDDLGAINRSLHRPKLDKKKRFLIG